MDKPFELKSHVWDCVAGVCGIVTAVSLVADDAPNDIRRDSEYKEITVRLENGQTRYYNRRGQPSAVARLQVLRHGDEKVITICQPSSFIDDKSKIIKLMLTISTGITERAKKSGKTLALWSPAVTSLIKRATAQNVEAMRQKALSAMETVQNMKMAELAQFGWKTLLLTNAMVIPPSLEKDVKLLKDLEDGWADADDFLQDEMGESLGAAIFRGMGKTTLVGLLKLIVDSRVAPEGAETFDAIPPPKAKGLDTLGTVLGAALKEKHPEMKKAEEAEEPEEETPRARIVEKPKTKKNTKPAGQEEKTSPKDGLEVE